MTSMDELFQIRDRVIKTYKNYECFIIPVLKFITLIIIFITMNNTIGYAKPLTKATTIFVLALIGTLSPNKLLMFLLISIVSLHIGSSSLEAGMIAFGILLLIYLLFIRLYPKESLFIIAMLLAYKLHIPYIVPLVAGLFSSVATVVSMIIGIMIWYSVPKIIAMMQVKAVDITSMGEVLNANIVALKELIKTDQTMVASIIILSIVLLTVYLISKQSIDYAEYIAILVGSIMNIIGFIFAILVLNIEIGLGALIISTTICGIIATISQFFAKALDYSRTEIVQFEDEENYYYVKVVPKIIVNQPKKQIRHIYSNDERPYESHES